MIRIVLYGISDIDLRLKIQSCCTQSNIDIIGVTDSFLSDDHICGMRYIPLAELNNIDFDYLMILTRDKDKQDEIKRSALSHSIEERKIVIPYIFMNESYRYVPDIYRWGRNQSLVKMGGVCIGLSYSFWGVDFEELKVKLLDFSWHGADLYYNMRCLFSLPLVMDRLLMVFPYYYFNYDMSLSPYQYESGQILAYRGFHDYHNALYSDSHIIRDYTISMGLFGDIYWRNVEWGKYTPKRTDELTIEKAEVLGPWIDFRPDTISENEIIFERIINLYKNKKITVVVPPLYKGGLSEKSKKIVSDMKEQFLGCINKYDVEFYDYSGIIDDPSCFFDYEHLNWKGRDRFTRLLNESIF